MDVAVTAESAIAAWNAITGRGLEDDNPLRADHPVTVGLGALFERGGPAADQDHYVHGILWSGYAGPLDWMLCVQPAALIFTPEVIADAIARGRLDFADTAQQAGACFNARVVREAALCHLDIGALVERVPLLGLAEDWISIPLRALARRRVPITADFLCVLFAAIKKHHAEASVFDISVDLAVALMEAGNVASTGVVPAVFSYLVAHGFSRNGVVPLDTQNMLLRTAARTDCAAFVDACLQMGLPPGIVVVDEPLLRLAARERAFVVAGRLVAAGAPLDDSEGGANVLLDTMASEETHCTLALVSAVAQSAKGRAELEKLREATEPGGAHGKRSLFMRFMGRGDSCMQRAWRIVEQVLPARD